MWHRLTEIAKSYHLDEDELVRFAHDHHDKFGIVVDMGYPEVNTWHTDALVTEFKKDKTENELRTNC